MEPREPIPHEQSQAQPTPELPSHLKSESEKRAFIDRLAGIVRITSNKPKLQVTTEIDPRTALQMRLKGQDPKRAWFRQTQHDPVTKRPIKELVRIPDSVVELTNENAARGKAAHEGSHAAITHFGEFVPDEVMQKTGFHALMAAAEERPTDNYPRVIFPGAGEWIDEARRDSAQEGENIRATQGIGYMPKFAQLCDLIVYERYYDELPDHYDPEVVDKYRQLEEHVVTIENTLPTEKAPKREAVDKAVDRYKIVYHKLWPEVQALLEEDRETESLRQMVEQSMRGDEDQPNPLDQLAQELLQELLAAINEAMKNMPGKTPTEPVDEPSDDTPVPTEDINQEPPSPEETPSEPSEVPGELVPAPDEDPDTEPSPNPEETPPLIPIPMDKLSEALIEALRAIFDALTEEEKQALRDQAEQELQNIEDAIVIELSDKLSDKPAETHHEHTIRVEIEAEAEAIRLEEEAKRDEERKRIKEAMDEIERKIAVQNESLRPYEQAYEAVRELDEELYNRLEEIFEPSIKRSVTYKSSGSRINLQRVFRWQSSREAGSQNPDTKIFESYHIPEKKDYAIQLHVDLSGSMNGEKIQETFKAVVLLAEVLNRLGVNFAISGFQDEVITFKEFDEELTDAIRARMAGMVLEAAGRNPEGHNQHNYNDDGPCLVEASSNLAKQPNQEKFLLAFSDGQPHGRHSTRDDLIDAVDMIIKGTDQKMIALGLGRGTQHVKTYYPYALPDLDVHQLTGVLGDLMEDMITHPEHYDEVPEDWTPPPKSHSWRDFR